MRILFVGDIVGKPARNCLKESLPYLKQKFNFDFLIGNGENAAGGSSITKRVAEELFSYGFDVITMGDHVFKKKEAVNVVEEMSVLRPLNLGELASGSGCIIKEKKGVTVAVINLVGRVFMPAVDCPFKAARDILEEIKEKTKIIFVDMHAEATSEKLALAYFLAGKVSAVCGTHTHIPTADERIIEGYTAYITDVGMVGSFNSILGREKAAVIKRFLTNMPTKFNISEEDIRIQGVVVDIDEKTGQALSIKRIEVKH